MNRVPKGVVRAPAPCIFLALVAALTLLAHPAEAQVRRGRPAPVTPGWAPISVGARFGWEQDRLSSGTTIGGVVRIPVVRSGIIEVSPGVDMVFLRGTEEYQYNVDVTWVPQGPRGGVFLGGGVGWRDSLYGSVEAGEARRTFLAYNVVVGGRTPLGPIQLEAMLRWAFLKGSDYSPNALSLGLMLPLWSVTPPRR